MTRLCAWMIAGSAMLLGHATEAAAAAPTISGSPPTTVAAGSYYGFSPTARDADRDTLTFSIANKPSWAAFNPATGRIGGTPTAAGTFRNIVISVSDGRTRVSLPSFGITVTGATGSSTSNRAPTISGTPTTTAAVGKYYGFSPTAQDTDRNTLTFSIANKPSWAAFNPTTGRIGGTPTAAGTFRNIVISVSDGKASASLPAFSITVSGSSSSSSSSSSSAGSSSGNRAPTISGTPTTTAAVGKYYGFSPTGKDADRNALTFSIANKPSWAAFNPATGRIGGTPTAAGTFRNIVISVSDGKASASLPAFTITVGGSSSSGSGVANRAPVISGRPATTVQAGSAFSFRPTASDADGNTISFSVRNKPAWATFNISTGQLSGTPSTAQAGSYTGIVISVSDGKASASLPAFAIAVTAAPTTSGSATLGWYAPTTNTDGSTLTDLAGYRLYHGTSANSLTDVRTISSPGITTYVFDQLSSGTHYFAVSAVNSSGVESSRTATLSKKIP